MLTRLSAVLGLCVALARPASGSTDFPIGIYGVVDATPLSRLAEEGIDTIHTYVEEPERLREILAEARAQGLQVLAAPDRLRASGAPEKKWPIRAWYLQDEPDVRRTPPETLEAMSRATREWDPTRPQTFVIGEGKPAERYGHVGDILMLDWYPVPHLALDSIALQIDLATKALSPGKPLWFVVQAFDWRVYPQRDPKKPRIGRFPTVEEMRFMVWLAVSRGATGIFFFTLTGPDGKTLFERPEDWNVVSRSITELRRLHRVLRSPRRTPPSWLANSDLEAAAWRKGGRDYLLLINRGPEMKPVPTQLSARRWRLLFDEKRSIERTLSQKDGISYLAPRQVILLQGQWSISTELGP